MSDFTPENPAPPTEPVDPKAPRQFGKGSTGPKTPEGKAASSKNALKEGFRSTRLIVTPENQAEHDALYSELLHAFAPVGPTENYIFHNLFHDAWNLHRIRNRMAALADCGIDPLDNPDCQKEYDRLDRYQSRTQSSLRSNIRELSKLQTSRAVQDHLPAPARDEWNPPLARTAAFSSLAKRSSLETHPGSRNPRKPPSPIRHSDFLNPKEGSNP